MLKFNYNKTLSNRYKTVINTPGISEREELARGVYAGRIQETEPLDLVSKNESFNFLISLNSLKRVINKRNSLIIGLLLASLGVSTASADAIGIQSNADHYKLYAHSRIINYKQTHCFISLMTKENRTWNPDARNGSHYGIGQMRNTKYRDLDGYRQIDWSLRYITKRYKTPCNAWEFFKANGYH